MTGTRLANAQIRTMGPAPAAALLGRDIFAHPTEHIGDTEVLPALFRGQ